MRAAPERADGLFICRSPGWTPPWCDPLFERLLDELAAGRLLEGKRPARRP
jgi:hypothetical protein